MEHSNAAQVLTSIAEFALDSHHYQALEIVSGLDEASDLFGRCLAIQERKFALAGMVLSADGNVSGESSDDGGVALESREEVEVKEQWASIEEPITRDTLLDTTLAHLHCLALLTGHLLGAHETKLAYIEHVAKTLLDEKLVVFAKESVEREVEILLVRSDFLSTLADARFRAGAIDIHTYRDILRHAFDGSSSALEDPGLLSDHAEALINLTVSERWLQHQSATSSNLPVAQSPLLWTLLCQALDLLAKAVKHPETANRAKLHLLRGDAELLRLQLSFQPYQHPPAIQSAAVLARNAEKFYRGAAASALMETSSGSLQDTTSDFVLDARFREAIAASLADSSSLDGSTDNGTTKIQEFRVKSGEDRIGHLLVACIDDGILNEQQVRRLGL